MIYVAAGRHVYHQPLGNLRYVHGSSLETTAGLPIAPRPFEPKGCPDNPLRGMGFKFGPFSDVTNPGTADASIGGFVQLLEIDPSSWWDTHELHSLSNSNACSVGEGRGAVIPPQMTMCGQTAASSGDAKTRYPFVAIIDSQQYTGPLGHPLAVICSPNMSVSANDYSCEMSYRLDEDLGVFYRFRTSLIPLSGLIDFDRDLRRRIAEAEVPDYWWPVLPTSRLTVHTLGEPH